MSDSKMHKSSFRDPSGHIFTRAGVLYRTVETSYAEHYDLLMNSGLYDDLTASGRLVRHVEVDREAPGGLVVHRTLEPDPIPFISYPWEWSFLQLKDAALLTLDLAWRALEHGMVLKDASAFNVQFVGAKPVFIDTLSFETYAEGKPWQAYRQFCQHFLAPLELHARVDPSLVQLFRANLEGIPLDVASKALPASSKLAPSIAMHIHAHARAQAKYAGSGDSARQAVVSKRSSFALLDSLKSAVERCVWTHPTTEWGSYYEDTNYSAAAMDDKLAAVGAFLDRIGPKMLWDFGANTGRFSTLASERGAYTVAFDIDPVAVDRAYLEARTRDDRMLLPLRLDLMNPSPSLGWALSERMSLPERGTPNAILALALVHHLAIANNVPLELVAEFFRELTEHLIIEFVPKTDSQVRRLLSSRDDVFVDYHVDGFERAFARHFEIEERQPLAESERTLYLMRRRSA